MQLDDNRFERNFSPPPLWEVRQSSLGAGAIGPPATGGVAPQPLDLKVPPNKKVVAVTGTSVFFLLNMSNNEVGLSGADWH